jgi:glycosyltransferase 2 family protein
MTAAPAHAERRPHPLRWVRAVCAAAGALLLLALAFRDVDAGRMLAILGSIRYQYLAVAIALDGGVFLMKSLKWRYIFAPVKVLPLSTFFSAIAVGTMSSVVLPFRLDELIRTFYFGIKGGLSKATVLGTIVVERAVDATTLAVSVGVLLLALRGHHGPSRAVGIAVLVLAAGAVLALTLLGRSTIADRMATRAGLRGLLDGLRVLERPGRLAGVFAFAAAEWLVTVLYMKIVLAAFGVELPFTGYLLLVTAGYLSFALPLAPGSLGIFEVLMKGSLVAGFAIDADTAMSCALVLHFMLVVPISMAGAIVLLRDGLTLAGIRALGGAPEADVQH